MVSSFVRKLPLHQRFGLRLKIDAGEATAHSIEIEPAPARQVQEHKAMRFYNNKKSSAGHYRKYSHAHKQNILHIWRLHLLRISMAKILKVKNYSIM